MVKEILSNQEFQATINQPKLVVADFYATWCGPCRMIAPFIEELSRKYPEVTFIKVGEHNCQDVIMSQRISAFPTFHFYVNGQKVDEMKGADSRTLENKVNQHKTSSPFGGAGNALGGWDGVGMPPSNARDARLKAFGHVESAPAASPAPASASAHTGDDMEITDDEILAQAIAASMTNTATTPAQQEAQDGEDKAQAEKEFAEWDADMVPVPVDAGLLQQLLDMEFPEVRARKGIVHGHTLEGAINWIAEHEEDPDIDQPYMVRKGDTVAKTPLTEEQKQAKIEELQAKIKQRRQERAAAEKAAELQREKERRARGQTMEAAQEERDRIARKREIERQKREKEEAKRERERLREEIARDKELRKANKGVLPSVLGVDGYNPSIVHTPAPATSDEIASKAPPPPGVPQPDKIDPAIATIMKYRTAGDGGAALKLLITFVKNIAENPTEPKYKSINMESKAFKAKLGALVGPVTMLKALGFTPTDDNKLQLSDEFDLGLFQATLSKLQQADELYTKQNPY